MDKIIQDRENQPYFSFFDIFVIVETFFIVVQIKSGYKVKNYPMLTESKWKISHLFNYFKREGGSLSICPFFYIIQQVIIFRQFGAKILKYLLVKLVHLNSIILQFWVSFHCQINCGLTYYSLSYHILEIDQTKKHEIRSGKLKRRSA